MGWDILAYYDIDQKEMDEFISRLGLNKEDLNDWDNIGQEYKHKYVLKNGEEDYNDVI